MHPYPGSGTSSPKGCGHVLPCGVRDAFVRVDGELADEVKEAKGEGDHADGQAGGVAERDDPERTEDEQDATAVEVIDEACSPTCVLEVPKCRG